MTARLAVTWTRPSTNQSSWKAHDLKLDAWKGISGMWQLVQAQTRIWDSGVLKIRLGFISTSYLVEKLLPDFRVLMYEAQKFLLVFGLAPVCI